MRVHDQAAKYKDKDVCDMITFILISSRHFDCVFISVNSVCVTVDGRTVISGSDDRTIKIWDIATGNCKLTLEGHSRDGMPTRC